MKRKGIRILAMALAAAFGVVGILPLAGRAAPVVDLNQKCSLTVYAASSDGEFAEELEKARVVIDLYRVGTAVEKPGLDGYGYQLDGFYGDLFSLYEGPEGSLIDASGELDEGKLNQETWRYLARQAAEKTLGVSPEETAPSGGGAAGAGTSLTPGENANVLVRKGVAAGSAMEDLEPGLYLLIARGADRTGVETYVQTAEDEEGRKHLVTTAYSENGGYTFEPVLVSIPTKEAGEDGVVSSTAPGPWIYDVSVYLKPGQIPYGSLYIVKDLLTYESSQEAEFVFQVDVTMDGRLIDSRVVAMTFTSAGRQKLLIEKLPVGAVVTVTEVYSGASYTQVGAGPEPVEIRASEVVSAAFVNDYDEREKGGHGIVNRFSYEYGEDGVGGWTVDQVFSGGEPEAEMIPEE
ncbi:MAG: hypothetical protein HFI93_01515 [Lachnospiraceae bacterium]|nr:hypothetical protein [Lachnospiraceae bacterium]